MNKTRKCNDSIAKEGNSKKLNNVFFSLPKGQPFKGQCHEMNNFFEDLKNQISIFYIIADGFLIFLHIYCFEKYF